MKVIYHLFYSYWKDQVNINIMLWKLENCVILHHYPKGIYHFIICNWSQLFSVPVPIRLFTKEIFCSCLLLEPFAIHGYSALNMWPMWIRN